MTRNTRVPADFDKYCKHFCSTNSSPVLRKDSLFGSASSSSRIRSNRRMHASNSYSRCRAMISVWRCQQPSLSWNTIVLHRQQQRDCLPLLTPIEQPAPSMNTLLNRSLVSCRLWTTSRAIIHTGSKQPAQPEPKTQTRDDEDDGWVMQQPPKPPGDSFEFKSKDGPKHTVRRVPGITDADEFMRIQKAWEHKLPLDEDPTIPDFVTERPVLGHTQVTMRKILSNQTMIKVQRKYDWSLGGMRRWAKRRERELIMQKQRFISHRHAALGPDLATAHFITFRGGRVKFVGHAEWFTDDNDLPRTFDENYLIEKIDASALNLMWEGLDNICNLYYLEDLNLTNGNELDVWCMDKICRQYRFSTKLRSLNVSRCENFCERSLETLHRLPSLEQVIITETPAVKYEFLDLVIMMLQDIRPKLRVII